MRSQNLVSENHCRL